MVGVDVGVQHELEVETKLADKTHVSLGLISHTMLVNDEKHNKEIMR